MVKKLKVDSNLIYLENVIYDLETHKFDDDVNDLLNQLKLLVINKLYSNFNLDGRDILNEETYIVYDLK